MSVWRPITESRLEMHHTPQKKQLILKLFFQYQKAKLLSTIRPFPVLWHVQDNG